MFSGCIDDRRHRNHRHHHHQLSLILRQQTRFRPAVETIDSLSHSHSNDEHASRPAAAIRSTVCLSDAPSSKTAHFRAVVTTWNTNRNPMLEVEPTGRRSVAVGPPEVTKTATKPSRAASEAFVGRLHHRCAPSAGIRIRWSTRVYVGSGTLQYTF